MEKMEELSGDMKNNMYCGLNPRPAVRYGQVRSTKYFTFLISF